MLWTAEPEREFIRSGARARQESRLVVIRHITKFILQPTDIGRFKSGQGRDGLTFGFGGVVDVLGKDHAKTTVILGSCVARLKRSLQGCCVVLAASGDTCRQG